MFSRDRVIGDDEASLAINKRDRTAETAFPERSRVRVAGYTGVAEGGKGSGSVYLLAASVGERQSQRCSSQERRAKEIENMHSRRARSGADC